MRDYEMMDAAIKRAEKAEAECAGWRERLNANAILKTLDALARVGAERDSLRAELARSETWVQNHLGEVTAVREELAEARAMSAPGGRWRLAERSAHMEEAARAIDAAGFIDVQSNGEDSEEVPAGNIVRRLAPLPSTLRAVPVEVLAQVREALASWVRVMDSMSSDPDDPATAIREQYHGKRLAQSRDALAALRAHLPTSVTKEKP